MTDLDIAYQLGVKTAEEDLKIAGLRRLQRITRAVLKGNEAEGLRRAGFTAAKKVERRAGRLGPGKTNINDWLRLHKLDPKSMKPADMLKAEPAGILARMRYMKRKS